ncbi:hypothetical protein ACLMJK_008030 [Lecanora helva]
MAALATIAVILRVVARKMSTLKFGPDDWLCGVSLEFVASSLIFVGSAAPAKLSVLFFYHRIFPERQFRIISIVIGIVVIIWFIAYVFIIFFICIPFAYNWDKTIKGGHCINSNDTAYYGTSPPDIATNLAILILPIPYLWKLQMHWQKKLAITVVFAVGSFATVGSIVRVPLLSELSPKDVSWSVYSSGIWLNVECNIGIISVCLPVLRPLFSRAFPSGFRSRFTRSRTHTSTRYGTGSQRIPDAEKGHRRSSTLVGSNGGSTNVYSNGGGRKNHRTWYNNAVTAIASKDDDRGSEGSQEVIIPMNRIGVTHEVDWETRDNASTVTPPA